MRGITDKSTYHRRRAAIGACLALAGLLALSATAQAGQDELKGGSVVIQLQNSRGLKLKPKNLTLPITGGAVDPLDGSGTVQVTGGFKARRGKGKAKVKITTLNLGANGGAGTITAKVAGDFVATFAKLSGGSVARSGFGVTISNIRATIASRGAKALNAAFSKKKHKGAKKSARGRVKAGQPLGTLVSVTTEPRSVEIVPNTGTFTLHTDLAGGFASKLPDHCIDPVTGGVAPIPPATQALADFDFPVTGGTAAPDFSAGEVLTGGGQTVMKNSFLPGVVTPASCPTAAPPTGSALTSTDLGISFEGNSLRSLPTLPDGTAVPRAPLADIDFSTGTRSFDPATNTITVTNATARLANLAASTLNQVFPNQSGSASNDFAAGDLIGTIDLTGVKLR